MPSRAVAGGMDRKARERRETARPADAQQAGGRRDMAWDASLGRILAGARSVARRAGPPAVFPPPGVAALATRPAACAVAARAMAPPAVGSPLTRARLAGAGPVAL